METKTYDLAISLGFSCGCTQSLRAAGLQFASYPFDWTGSPGLLASVGMIERDFAHWLDREDLELYDVRRAPLFSRVYRNARTGFGFPHDFSSFGEFDAEFPEVQSRYERRSVRLLKTVADSRCVLFVYVERMINPRLSDDELRDAQSRLSAKFPGVAVDLLYFHQGDGVAVPVARCVDDRVVAVQVDYAREEGGRIVHEMNRTPVESYLRGHVRLVARQSDTEKDARDSFLRKKRSRRWGKAGFFRRLVNEIAYKTYRRLERRLVDRGVIPREEPLWF